MNQVIPLFREVLCGSYNPTAELFDKVWPDDHLKCWPLKQKIPSEEGKTEK